MSEEQAFGGQMPSREGQAVLEVHGMAPVPLANRYGRLFRVFTVWFTPNLVPAAFFIGTLVSASYIGLGFWLGSLACLIGAALGAVPVALLATYGPRTGLGQLPLGAMFLVITVKIAEIGNFHSPATAHGGNLVGGFLLLATISASFVVAWATYASDYTRYMRPEMSRGGIFALTLAGVTVSTVWVEVLGAAVGRWRSTPWTTTAGRSPCRRRASGCAAR